MKLGALVVVSLALGGCSRDGASADKGTAPPPERAGLGHERGDCKADKTCDPGLLCLSNLCVRPPPADCQAVADGLASMELGNYAEPEARAPIVANYKAACEKVYVSKEEGECLDKAKDKWTASQCAPRMFPELASPAGGGDCTKVTEKIRALMMKQVQGMTDPTMRQMFDGAVKVITQSCEEDKWPVALKNCIISAPDTGQDAMTQCNQQMPPGLQQKMQDRMMKLMNKVTGK